MTKLYFFGMAGAIIHPPNIIKGADQSPSFGACCISIFPNLFNISNEVMIVMRKYYIKLL